MPIALWPSKNDGEEHVFSGSAAVNDNGELMLFYTSIGGRLPEQWAAIPEDDDLVRWKKHPANPILTEALHDQKTYEWRDPYHFKAGDDHYLVLGGNLNNNAGGQAIVGVYRAENKELTRWKYQGVLFQHPDANIKNIECPLFFRLGNRWVLIISQGQPVQYFVGDLDRKTMKFTPTNRGVMDWGNYYAPNCFTDPAGATTLWGWMNGTPAGRGWRHCMTLPRRLSIGDDGTLRQRPAEALATLRGKPMFQIAGEIDTAGRTMESIQGDALELLLSVEPRDASGLQVTLPRSNGAPAIRLSLQEKQVELQGSHAEIELPKDGPFDLRLFVDHSVVELYINDQACITRSIDTPHEGAAVESLNIRPEGGSATFKNLTAWPIRSGWIESAATAK
jgi:beta-fructofuranosidase